MQSMHALYLTAEMSNICHFMNINNLNMILLIVIVYNQSRKVSLKVSTYRKTSQPASSMKCSTYIFFITYKSSNLAKFLGSQMADL